MNAPSDPVTERTLRFLDRIANLDGDLKAYVVVDRSSA